DGSVAAARAQLDEATFAAAWAEGQVLTLEQVIAEARKPIRKSRVLIRKPADMEISDDTGVYQIPNELWERIAPELPPAHDKRTGRPRMDDRQAMAAIFHALQTGCGWKALPRALGAPSTIYDRFKTWRASGVFDRLWRAGLLTEAMAWRVGLAEREQEI